MNKGVKTIQNIQVETTIRNLRNHNFTVDYFETKEEMLSFLDQQIQSGSVVGHGGSITLQETGVVSYLEKRDDIDYLAFDRFEDPNEGFHRALNSDVYLMSSNAITSDGMLYNVDGLGNRIAALIYGPKKVYVIAGVNKIVKDLDAAKQRVEQIAAPANCVNLHKPNPCTKIGFCAHCNLDTTICNQYLVTRRSRNKERIHVLLINDQFGN